MTIKHRDAHSVHFTLVSWVACANGKQMEQLKTLKFTAVCRPKDIAEAVCSDSQDDCVEQEKHFRKKSATYLSKDVETQEQIHALVYGHILCNSYKHALEF